MNSPDYRDIRRTLNSTPGPPWPLPCILVGTTWASPECGQIWENLHYTVNKVPLTKISLRASLVAHNFGLSLFSLEFSLRRPRSVSNHFVVRQKSGPLPES